MAVVFVYGGVAPDDVLRGYIVLIVTALGLGSFGLFCSSLVKRTQAATAITIFGVLAITIGTVFVLAFWAGDGAQSATASGSGPFKGRAPEVVAYLNPFIAQADVLCGTETTQFGAWCSIVQRPRPEPERDHRRRPELGRRDRRRRRCRRRSPASGRSRRSAPARHRSRHRRPIAVDATDPIGADVVAFGVPARRVLAEERRRPG